MKTIENKIAENFKLIFSLEAEIIEVKENYACVYSQNIWYSCKLNSKGVKNNSWKRSI